MENDDKKKKEDSIFYSIKGFICLEKSRSQLYLLSNDYHNKAVIRGAYWEHENPSADRYTLFKRLNDPLLDNCTLQKIDEN